MCLDDVRRLRVHQVEEHYSLKKVILEKQIAYLKKILTQKCN